ncbi:MAG: hypothetical protein IJ019_01755 [Alphaproteobacteria bacterium]|nr:hypothetical protein [Alphaproteobacteria bacterium]
MDIFTARGEVLLLSEGSGKRPKRDYKTSDRSEADVTAEQERCRRQLATLLF